MDVSSCRNIETLAYPRSQAQYIQTLHQLLEATIAPDTNVIKAVSGFLTARTVTDILQATTQLNTQFYKNPTCIPTLYEISVTSSNQAVSLPHLPWLTLRSVNSLP